MSRQHSDIKIGNSGAFVNGLAVFASVALIASGYVSALGAFAAAFAAAAFASLIGLAAAPVESSALWESCKARLCFVTFF